MKNRLIRGGIRERCDTENRKQGAQVIERRKRETESAQARGKKVFTCSKTTIRVRIKAPEHQFLFSYAP